MKNKGKPSLKNSNITERVRVFRSSLQLSESKQKVSHHGTLRVETYGRGLGHVSSVDRRTLLEWQVPLSELLLDRTPPFYSTCLVNPTTTQSTPPPGIYSTGFVEYPLEGLPQIPRQSSHVLQRRNEGLRGSDSRNDQWSDYVHSILSPPGATVVERTDPLYLPVSDTRMKGDTLFTLTHPHREPWFDTVVSPLHYTHYTLRKTYKIQNSLSQNEIEGPASYHHTSIE